MTSGRPAFQQHAEHTKSGDTTPRLAHAENHERRMYKSTISTKAKRSRSPAGPRRLRNSDAHKRIAAPKAFCVLQERLRPSPKSGKTCRSDTRPGDVGERAERSESSDTTPIRNAPCFGVQAAVCDPSPKAECVPAFTRESERGPFVREAEKRDEMRFGTALCR